MVDKPKDKNPPVNVPASQSKTQEPPAVIQSNVKATTSPKVELVSTANDNLVFKVDGKKIELTPNQLEQLLKINNAEEDKKKPDSIGRIGLKTGNDVSKFIKSAAGKTVEKIIHDILDNIKAMQEKERQRQIDRQLMMRRIKGLLLLAFLYKKHARADSRLHHLYQEEIKRIINEGKKAYKAGYNSVVSPQAAVSEINAIYALAGKIASNALDQKLKEAALVEKQLRAELDAIQRHQDSIQHRYAVFDTHINALDNHYDGLADLSEEDQISEMERRITEINNAIQEHTTAMQKAILANKDVILVQRMPELNGLFIQRVDMLDMLAMLKNERALFNADGQPVKSFREADFILPTSHKLVKQDGRFYLLREGQDFNSLTEEEKTKAHQAFERAKPDITNVRKLINQNRELETHTLNERNEQVTRRHNDLQAEIKSLASQSNTVQQAAQASTDALMQDPTVGDLAARIPTPKPTMKANVREPEKTTHSSVSQSYREVLKTMSKNSPQTVQDLKNDFRLIMERELTQFKAGKTATPSMVRSLLTYIERIGGRSAYDPSITTVPRPTPTRSNEPEKSTAPTPFSRVPKPYDTQK